MAKVLVIDDDIMMCEVLCTMAERLGHEVAYALTGTFFVELIFNWPGLGTFTVHSLLNVDYPAIMGVTLFAAVGYVIINLGVDLLQSAIDPRLTRE